MRTILLAAAALALTGSAAHSAFLLGADQNDHKAVINTDAPQRTATSPARIGEPAVRPASSGFLLGAGAGSDALARVRERLLD